MGVSNKMGETMHSSSLSRIAKTTVLLALAVLIGATLSSCSLLKWLGIDKTEVTFDANGGEIAEGYETGKNAHIYKEKFKVGEELPDNVVTKAFYNFDGWYTKRDGGKKVEKVPEKDITLYARWKSLNKDKAVKITGITTGSKDNQVRIKRAPEENKIKVKFTINKFFGQDVAFVDKDGKVITKIEVAETGDTSKYSTGGLEVEAEIPNNDWMDAKETTYYIKSMANDHVDESKPAEVKIKLAGQYKNFDQPIEGSTVWYGGTAKAPKDRTGIVLATDTDHVYATGAKGGEVYTWDKSEVMINLPDVLTKPVYDIYNAYDSRFFPITGKCMYSNNGKSGLDRYKKIEKEAAMHQNAKIDKAEFIVPVQWSFAEKIADAEKKALKAGNTLYIVDTFRPIDCVGPVAKKVNDPSLLAPAGNSAHNFGLAVDTGWQKIGKNGQPEGEPQVKNLHVLNKKAAIDGPNGNRAESWWEGVPKLRQEWWHYGDGALKAGYREQAKRVAGLYVNEKECISKKRSQM